MNFRALLSVALVLGASAIEFKHYGYNAGAPGSPCNACSNSAFARSDLESLLDRGKGGKGGGGSKAKLSSLTLKYTTTNTNQNSQGSYASVNIRGALPSTATVYVLGQQFQVADGQTFTVSGFSGAVTTFTVAGSTVGFHTSCSVAIVIGDQVGFLQVAGFTNQNGGNGQGCVPDNVCYETTADCPGEVPAPPCDVCARAGKGNFGLTFEVNGGSISGSIDAAGYGNGKHYLNGGALSATGPFTVTCYNAKSSSQSYGSWTVNAGATFSAGPGFSTELECRITDQTGASQVAGIHTSCSFPIQTDMRFGALTIVDFTGSTGCPGPYTPPCELCCTTPPIKSTSTYSVITGKTDICTAGKLPSPESAALTTWLNNRAGAECQSTNLGPSAGIEYTITDLAGTELAYDDLEAILCATTADFCPETKIQVTCREICVPENGIAFDEIVFDDATFEVGYQSESECPGPIAGVMQSCDVCYPQGFKRKPSTIEFTLVGGAATLTNGQEGKARASGATLQAGSITSATCSNAAATFNGDKLIVSSFRSADMTCTVSGPGGTQTINAHVSCSKLLRIGDQFGALKLTSFTNSYGSAETQCPFSPPQPAPPCPLCCVMKPIAGFPEITSVPKIGVCVAGVLPSETKTQLQDWLDSFKPITRNTPHQDPIITMFENGVEIFSAHDLQAQLCNTSSVGACHSLEVMFRACDPCRPEDTVDGEAHCIEKTVGFECTDSLEPLIRIENAQTGCQANVADENTLVDGWANAAVCKDLAKPLASALTFVKTSPQTTDECTRTYSAQHSCSDECANGNTKESKYVFVDDAAPQMTTMAADQTMSCEADIATELANWVTLRAGAVATDCTRTIWSDDYTPRTMTHCDAVPVTWTVNDPCDNDKKTTSATFTVTDTVAPVITNQDGVVCVEGEVCVSETVACSSGRMAEDAIERFSNLTCTDNCDTDAKFLEPKIYYETQDENNCVHVVKMEYVCEDSCGNSVSTLAQFTTEDQDGPILVGDGPQDFTVECDGEGNIPDLERWLEHYAGASCIHWATDTCQENPSCYHPHNGASLMNSDHWSPTAACTYADKPVCAGGFTYPNRCIAMENGHNHFEEGACTDYLISYDQANFKSSGTHHNNCSYCANIPVSPVCCHGTNEYDNYCYAYCQGGTFDYVAGPCAAHHPTPPPSAEVEYIQNPNTAPSADYITCTPDCECSNYVEEICGNDGKTYVNRCVAECHGIFYYSLGSCANLFCGESQLMYTHVKLGLPDLTNVCERRSTFEFTVIDQCNTDPLKAQADFVTKDTTPPTILDINPETTVECDGAGNSGAFHNWLAVNAGAKCEDDCTDCSFGTPAYDKHANGEPVYTLCGHPEVVVDWTCGSALCNTCDRCILVTFNAADECGNIAETTAVFRTVDSTPPRLNGGNVKAECNKYVEDEYAEWLANHGDAVAVDLPDCSGVGIHNIRSTLQLFDSDGFEIPAGVHGSPPGTLPSSIISELMEVFPDIQLSLTQKCPFVTVMGIYAEDNCGNAISKNVSYVIQDTTKPEFTVDPSDLEVDCGSWVQGNEEQLEAWLKAGGGGMCSDDCTLLPMISTIPLYDDAELTGLEGSCPKQMVVQFYCEDFCGNRAYKPATFSVKDIAAPTLTDPQSRTVECGPTNGRIAQKQAWAESYAGALGYDTCTSTDMLTYKFQVEEFSQNDTDTMNPQKCSNMHANGVFACEDGCGLETSKAATFSVTDTQNPLFTSGGFDLTYTCLPECTNRESTARKIVEKWTGLNGCLTAEDCQESMDWSFEGLPTGNLCGTSGTITYTVEDGCGNPSRKTLKYNFPKPGLPSAPVPSTCEICSKQNKKSIAALTFKWVSASGLPTTVSASNVPASNGGFVENNGRVTFNAASRHRGTFDAWTTFTTTFGSQKLHTSCSIPLYVGMKIQYNSGYLEIVGFALASGRTEQQLCPGFSNPVTTEVDPAYCDVDVASLDVCACLPVPTPDVVFQKENACNSGKPTELEFRYIGGYGLTNTQNGKSSASGPAIDTPSVRITCYRKKGSQIGPQTVNKGDIFIVSGNGNKLGTELSCVIEGISGGAITGRQQVEIHTSCSMSLNTGDVFGSIQLACFKTNTGASCLRGTSTDLSKSLCPTPPPVPMPTPPPFSTPGNPGTPPGATNGPQCNACRNKQSLSYITFRYITGNQLTNNQNNKATLSGGAITAEEVSVTCDATMEVVSQAQFMAKKGKGKSHHSGGGQTFNDMVTVGINDVFSVSGFGTWTTCTISGNGVIQAVDIHTSCSVSLAIGDIYGSIVITGFSGSNTGVVGEQQGCSSPSVSLTASAPTPAVTPVGGEPCFVDIDGLVVCAGNGGGSNGGGAVVDTCSTTDVCNGGSLTRLILEYHLPAQSDNEQRDVYDGYQVDNRNWGTRESFKITSGAYGVPNVLNRGDRFEIAASAIDRDTLPQAIAMTFGSASQARVRFQVNCRAPLSVGDTFGPIKVVGFANTNGESCTIPDISASTSAEVSASASGGASGSAIAGIVAGCLLVVVMMVGVYRISSKQAMQEDVGKAPSLDLPNQGRDLVWDNAVRNEAADKI